MIKPTFRQGSHSVTWKGNPVSDSTPTPLVPDGLGICPTYTASRWANPVNIRASSWFLTRFPQSRTRSFCSEVSLEIDSRTCARTSEVYWELGVMLVSSAFHASMLSSVKVPENPSNASQKAVMSATVTGESSRVSVLRLVMVFDACKSPEMASALAKSLLPGPCCAFWTVDISCAASGVELIIHLASCNAGHLSLLQISCSLSWPNRHT